MAGWAAVGGWVGGWVGSGGWLGGQRWVGSAGWLGGWVGVGAWLLRLGSVTGRLTKLDRTTARVGKLDLPSAGCWPLYILLTRLLPAVLCCAVLAPPADSCFMSWARAQPPGWFQRMAPVLSARLGMEPEPVVAAGGGK